MRITCWLFNYDIKCENFASIVLSHRNELWFFLKDPVLWAFCSFVSWSWPSLLEFSWKRNFRSMDFHDQEKQRLESHTASDSWGNNLSKKRASCQNSEHRETLCFIRWCVHFLISVVGVKIKKWFFQNNSQSYYCLISYILAWQVRKSIISPNPTPLNKRK